MVLRQFSSGISSAVGRAGCGMVSEQSLCHNSFFRIHPSVQQALSEGKPVVALESTIITHGMPYPHNISRCKSRPASDIIKKVSPLHKAFSLPLALATMGAWLNAQYPVRLKSRICDC
ncbi:pseudouridine-metabolizing bifunctional -like [Pelobates cultripes]|nr:pseudouridine-metabolizing bifunctional -like [Pelobates cultripes]